MYTDFGFTFFDGTENTQIIEHRAFVLKYC